LDPFLAALANSHGYGCSYISGYSKLTGSIPSAVGKPIDLTEIDIAYNQLVGSLPRAHNRVAYPTA
jgi:hypothetical protein